jgi:hypothetical protein
MPVSDYTLEVIAAGISFGAAQARERLRAGLALRARNYPFPAGTGNERAHEGSTNAAARARDKNDL